MNHTAHPPHRNVKKRSRRPPQGMPRTDETVRQTFRDDPHGSGRSARSRQRRSKRGPSPPCFTEISIGRSAPCVNRSRMSPRSMHRDRAPSSLPGAGKGIRTIRGAPIAAGRPDARDMCEWNENERRGTGRTGPCCFMKSSRGNGETGFVSPSIHPSCGRIPPWKSPLSRTVSSGCPGASRRRRFHSDSWTIPGSPGR